MRTIRSQMPSPTQRRHVSRRRLLGRTLLGGAGLASLALLGCGDDGGNGKRVTQTSQGTPGQTEPTVKRGGTLRLFRGTQPVSWDSLLNQNYSADLPVLAPVYDRLFEIDKDGKLLIGEGLVAKYENPDPLTHLMTLQENVTFHDGTPFNAEAVAKHLTRGKEFPRSTARGTFASFDRVETPDTKTANLKLSSGFADLPLTLLQIWGGVISPTAVEKLGLDLATNPVGTGPFKFEQQQPGASWTLVKNPNYWKKDLPYLERVVYTVIVQSQQQAGGLRTSQFDASATGAPVAEFEMLQADPNLVVGERPGSSISHLVVNANKPPFDDKALRQAISHALNREDLVAVATTGHGSPLYSYIAPGQQPYFDPDFRPVSSKGDPSKAKRLLAQAGKASGFDFTLDATATAGQPSASTELIQAQLKSLGVNTQIRLNDSASNTQRWISEDFELLFSGWVNDINAYSITTSFLGTGSTYNTREKNSRYPGQQVDDLIKRIGNEVDQEARVRLYRELQRIIWDEAAPAIPMYATNILTAARKDVRGWELRSDNAPRLTRVWLDR